MLNAVILGIVQGITEFFPVSSTAHLILLPWVFGWHGQLNTLTFDVAVHAGTLGSLIICFFPDWISIFKSNQKLLGLIALATLPAGAAGIFFNDFIESSLRTPLIIAVMLIIFGVLMLISEKFGKLKTIDNITPADSLIIGLSQAVALIPGVSRSGITISAGMIRGFKREDSARFSFLLSTPIVLGATLLEGRKLITYPQNYDLMLFSVGFLSSLVAGTVAIKFLLRFLRRHPMNVFVYYRFIVAFAILGLAWLRG